MTEDKSIQNDRIIVLAPIAEEYIFSKPLQWDYAKYIYNEVKARVKKDFRDAAEFNVYFEFDEKTSEINGLNTFYGILINDVLSESGLWLPTIAEAKKLEAAGKLKNGVWRKYGIAVYDSQNPNSKIAKILVDEARKRNWNLPILAPFKALKLNKKGNRVNGISFAKNAQGIIYGDEAEEFIDKQIDYRGINGACWLGRGRYGSWFTGDVGLLGSNVSCRVDFVCGEATAKNLESAILEEISKTAQIEVEKLNSRISNARQAAIDALNA